MPKKITRFYLNGHLHRVLHLNKAKDKLTAFDYIDGKTKVYNWSDVKKQKQNAFTISEAAELVGRHRERIMEYLIEGKIEYPQREYSLETGNPGRWFFSEDDMLDLHDYMSTIHIGRPRNDGRVTNNSLPTKEQLKGMIQSGRVLYIREEGQFIPIWKAQEW